jgi:uncharacterized protein YgiM (DUF1202 family)
MKTVFKILLLLNVSVLFAGGPSKNLNIINLTGEEIYFTIRYNKNMGSYIYESLENKRITLSPDQYDPTPDSMILRMLSRDDNIMKIIENSIIELNIYNKSGVKILTKENLLRASMPFIYNVNYRDSGVEDYPGELDWTGSYYFIITKSDLKKPNESQFSHRTTERLNLRENDHISSSVIKVLSSGERLTALQIGDVYQFNDTYNSHWIKVKTSDGLVGWCVSDYIEPY